MANLIGCEINLTGKNENTAYNQYPTWFFTKEAEVDFIPNDRLQQIGAEIRKKTRQANRKKIKITKQNVTQIIEKIKVSDPIFASEIRDMI